MDDASVKQGDLAAINDMLTTLASMQQIHNGVNVTRYTQLKVADLIGKKTKQNSSNNGNERSNTSY